MLMKEAYHQLQVELQHLYDKREAIAISDWIIEDISNLTKSQRIIHHDIQFTPDQEIRFFDTRKQLLEGKPVQYVLGYAWFKGEKFKVNEHVLIPRPETEELVDTIIEYEKAISGGIKQEHTILDIGTGSGCIAISLQLAFPHWHVWAIDKSHLTLETAAENARQLLTSINFKEIDILSNKNNDQLPPFHLIVSNPPYIPNEDKHEMTAQVLEHEPHLALFVTNDDPLQFYKAILSFSESHLIRGGTIWFETHMNYAQDVATLLKENDYLDVVIKKDFQGRDRIVSGKRSGASL